MGAHVIGTVGSPEKAAIAAAAGAKDVVQYTTQDVVAEVQRITGGKGCTVVRGAACMLVLLRMCW